MRTLRSSTFGSRSAILTRLAAASSAWLAAATFGLLAASCENARKPPAGGGLVVVNARDAALPNDWDLGRVDYGQAPECTVKLENRDRTPIQIRSITPGCSCAVPSVSYTSASGELVRGHLTAIDGPILELPPGAVADLRVVVDTKLVAARNTTKRVVIRIVTNSPATPFVTLEVHLIVDFPFQVVPAIINLGEVPIGVGAASGADIVAIGPRGERVVGILSKPDVLEATLEDIANMPEPGWRLNVRWMPPLTLGPQSATVVLKTSRPAGEGEGRPLDVTVQAIGVADIGCSPTQLTFGAPGSDRGDVAEVELATRVPGQRLAVQVARIEGDDAASLRATVAPIEPDERGASTRWRVQLHCDPALGPKALGGALVLALDDANTPELRIAYSRAPKP
jgi:hypothetical protein